MASPFVELEVGERVVKLTNPDKVLFPKATKTKRDLAEYYIAVGDGIVRALYERPTQLRRFPGRRHGRGDLPEARPREAARVGRVGARHVPVGAPCGRALRDGARAGRLGREPRGRRLPPLAVAAPRHGASGRAADRHRPAAGHDVQGRKARRCDRPRGARRDRLHGLAEDVGEPRHPRLLPDRAELGVPGRAPRGTRVRARGRAARAEEGDDGMVEGGARASASSSTTTRTPATAPWRPPTRCAVGRTRRSRRP